MFFIIGWLVYVVKHLGKIKERKIAHSIGLGIVMMKSLKMLRMTRLRRQG